MKYLNTMITFSEFPDEIALCINITNCSFHCPGCHSPELWEDIGTELTKEKLSTLIESSNGITCVGFMGGTPKEVNSLGEYIKVKYPNLKVGWYWGGDEFPDEIESRNFDYIKIGHYDDDLGGIDNPKTNQRFYHMVKCMAIDCTSKFWKHGE